MTAFTQFKMCISTCHDVHKRIYHDVHTLMERIFDRKGKRDNVYLT